MVELMAAIEARKDQLVAALDQWNEARRLARNEAAKLPRRNGANSFTTRSIGFRAKALNCRRIVGAGNPGELRGFEPLTSAVLAPARVTGSSLLFLGGSFATPAVRTRLILHQ